MMEYLHYCFIAVANKNEYDRAIRCIRERPRREPQKWDISLIRGVISPFDYVSGQRQTQNCYYLYVPSDFIGIMRFIILFGLYRLFIFYVQFKDDHPEL